MTDTFFPCSRFCEMQSGKSWWPNYKYIQGHFSINETTDCKFLLVPKTDFNNFLIFASQSSYGSDSRYRVNITRNKSWFGDYWTISDFAVFKS